MTKKLYNRNKPEYIDKLPVNVFDFGNVLGHNFSRYWIDLDKLRIIMKTKNNNKYKIIKPYYDKWNNTFYFNPIDDEGNSYHWRYYDLITCYSYCYYLNNDYEKWW